MLVDDEMLVLEEAITAEEITHERAPRTGRSS